MHILYVFPHPDDESFGPALAIERQRKGGASVHLLTLTRGGATRERHRLGLSVDEMGSVRRREMEKVREVLGLETMSVLDYPDSGLADLDPRVLEKEVAAAILAIRPAVVVTYAVRGVSGFPDHLVTHAVVKRAWCEVREDVPETRRLAFFTIAGAGSTSAGRFTLFPSPPGDVDCVVPVDSEAMETASRALECHVSYADTIRQADPLSHFTGGVPFEIFDEQFDPVLDDLTAQLP